MLTIPRFQGGLTNTDGCCPGCGCEVPRLHSWNSAGMRDAYDCPSCGTFEYASSGGHLPARPPAELTAVLDSIDCIG